MSTTWTHAKVDALYYLFNFYLRHAQFGEITKTESRIEKMCQPGDSVTQGLIYCCQASYSGQTKGFEERLKLLRFAIFEFQKVQFRDVFYAIRMTIIVEYLSCLKGILSSQITVMESRSDYKIDEEEFEQEFERGVKWCQENALIHITSSNPLHHIAEVMILEGKAVVCGHKLKVEPGQKLKEEAASTYLELLNSSRKSNYTATLAVNALIELASLVDNREEQERYLNQAEETATHECNMSAHRYVLQKAAFLYHDWGKHEKAFERMKASLNYDMNVPQEFDLSLERISIIDNYRTHFWIVELFNMYKIYGEEVETKKGQVLVLKDTLEPLLWAERGHCRDFLYSIEKKHDRESHSINSSVFDNNDVEASAELNSVLQLAGTDTVFIVFSYVGTYFVRAGCPPLFHLNVGILEDMSNKMDPILRKHNNMANLSLILEQWQAVLRDLFQHLMGKWEEILEKDKIKRVVIVPNEQTSAIPFAALICSDGKYFIEKYEVCVVGSLRLFKYCEMRRCYLAKQKQEIRKALVVANPTRNSPNEEKANPKGNLPNAEKEGQFVSNFLKNAGLDPELLVGDAAQVDKVLTSLQKSCWVHMACHTRFQNIPSGALKLRGELYDGMCGLGALELADDQIPEDSICNVAERGDTSKKYKGLLTAEQICEGEEVKAVVTILAACSSGSGDRRVEGTLGLTRSFHFVGVPTVVASLWPVHDETTMILMETLYAKIIGGLPIATALRESILPLIGNNTHPFYWAPFFVSGSPAVTLSDVVT